MPPSARRCKLREKELARARMALELEGRAEQKARTKELEAKLKSLIDDVEYQLREIVKGIGDKTAGAEDPARLGAPHRPRAARVL